MASKLLPKFHNAQNIDQKVLRGFEEKCRTLAEALKTRFSTGYRHEVDCTVENSSYYYPEDKFRTPKCQITVSLIPSQTAKNRTFKIVAQCNMEYDKDDNFIVTFAFSNEDEVYMTQKMSEEGKEIILNVDGILKKIAEKPKQKEFKPAPPPMKPVTKPLVVLKQESEFEKVMKDQQRNPDAEDWPVKQEKVKEEDEEVDSHEDYCHLCDHDHSTYDCRYLCRNPNCAKDPLHNKNACTRYGVSCQKCKRFGHYAIECATAPCKICGYYNHMEKDCKSRCKNTPCVVGNQPHAFVKYTCYPAN